MKRLVIAGGSGFIGSELIPAAMSAGYKVVVLSRGAHAAGSRVEGRGSEIDSSSAISLVEWDGKTVGPWKESLEGAEAVVNLSGANIAKHWTDDYKLEILQSRIQSTRAIGDAVVGCTQPPKSWINGSAVGIYGDRGGETLTEESPAGPKGQFLVDTCVAWEAEADRFRTPSTRLVKLRTGQVLGRGGGMFKPLYTLTKFFLGGHAGDGSQYVSWIHMEDHIRMVLWLIENGKEGVYNAVAPEPVTNRFLMATMRAVMHRPWAPPAPAFMLKLVEGLGGPPASLLLQSQRVVPQRALAEGFQFRYGSLRDSVLELSEPGRRALA